MEVVLALRQAREGSWSLFTQAEGDRRLKGSTFRSYSLLISFFYTKGTVPFVLFASTFDEKVNKTASFYVIFTVLIIENEEKSVILQCVFV